MATFNFSPVKLNKEPKHSTANNKILEHDVEGYVSIRLNGEFYVLYNNKEYPIKQENYDCKNIKNVYILKIEKNNRIYIARNENLQSLSKHFRPFAPGCIVKGNTTCLFFGQLQHLLNMPSNSFSLAVRVAREPNLIGLESLFAQRINQLYLIFFDYIVRSIAIAKVNTHAVFTNTLDITNVPLRRHQMKILAQILGNGFSFARGLNYH
jgi:hypothetical protein